MAYLKLGFKASTKQWLQRFEQVVLAAPSEVTLAHKKHKFMHLVEVNRESESELKAFVDFKDSPVRRPDSILNVACPESEQRNLLYNSIIVPVIHMLTSDLTRQLDSGSRTVSKSVR